MTDKKTLETIAEKFGKIPTNIRKRDDVIAGGYLTEEEFSLLPECPRTGAITSAGTWVKIGGRQTYPMTGALTKEERQQYYGFKNSGSGTSRVKTASKEDLAAAEAVRQELKKLNASQTIMDLFEQIAPKDEASAKAQAMADKLAELIKAGAKINLDVLGL